MFLDKALINKGDKKYEATPMMIPKAIILTLLIVRIMCLLSPHERVIKTITNNASVIAVPNATPNAGLSLKITKPNKSDKQILSSAALKTETK